MARAINGASGGTVGIANAYIADVTNSNYGRHQSRSHVLRVRMLSWDNLGGQFGVLKRFPVESLRLVRLVCWVMCSAVRCGGDG